MRRSPALLLALASGCFSPYVLPSVGFDQTAAMLPPHGAEVAVGGGYQLATSASAGGQRSGAELPEGSALGSFALGHAGDLLVGVGEDTGEVAFKLRLPVGAFDLALQPEAGLSSGWRWQSNQPQLQGQGGTLGGGLDLLASGPIAPGLALYGGLRALGLVSAAGGLVAGAGLGVEWKVGPVLLRPELAVSQLFGLDGSTQFIAYPHLVLAVRP